MLAMNFCTVCRHHNDSCKWIGGIKLLVGKTACACYVQHQHGRAVL